MGFWAELLFGLAVVWLLLAVLTAAKGADPEIWGGFIRAAVISVACGCILAFQHTLVSNNSDDAYQRSRASSWITSQGFHVDSIHDSGDSTWTAHVFALDNPSCKDTVTVIDTINADGFDNFDFVGKPACKTPQLQG